MIEDARLKTATDTKAFSRALSKRKQRNILKLKQVTSESRNKTPSINRAKNNSALAVSFLARVGAVNLESQKSISNNYVSYNDSSMVNFIQDHHH
jgi:hypothetical protein